MNKHLTQADNNAMKQIRFIRHISLTMLCEGLREYEDADDRFLHQLYTTKGDKFYANNTQIHDIVGDEEWLNGEIKTLSNMGSNRIVALTWG